MIYLQTQFEEKVGATEADAITGTIEGSQSHCKLATDEKYFRGLSLLRVQDFKYAWKFMQMLFLQGMFIFNRL